MQLDHKVGNALWKANFMLRMVLNKSSFGLIPPPAIQLFSLRPDLSLQKVMLRVNAVTFALCILGSILMAKFSLTLLHWITGK